MSVLPSSAEELPETAVIAWTRCFLTPVVNKSAIVDFSLPILLVCDHLTGSKVFINDRAVYRAWPGKYKIWHLACMANFLIYIFRIYVKLHVWHFIVNCRYSFCSLSTQPRTIYRSRAIFAYTYREQYYICIYL